MKKILKIVKVLLPIILLVLILFEGRSMLAEFDMKLIDKHIKSLSFLRIVSIIAIGLVGVIPMLFYDIIFTKKLKIKIPLSSIVIFSWITNTFSNFIGFGGFAGVALRNLFYKPEYEGNRDLLKEIVKNSLFFLTGISLLSWSIILGIFKTPLLYIHSWMYLVIGGVALYLPIMLFVSWFKSRKEDGEFELFYDIKLVIASFFEWNFAMLTIWGIAQILALPVTFLQLMPIFIVAACVGIVSMIPGGLGSFDLIMLLGFEALHIPKESILFLLILYRLTYYVIPWLIGCYLFVHHYWKSFNSSWNGIPDYLVQTVTHRILTFLVFAAGIVLLLSAALPAVVERLAILRYFFSSSVIGVSQQLSVASGISLLVLSRGIGFKVKRAFYLTLVVLVFSALFALSKGIDYEEAVFVLIVAWLLWLSKDHFTRDSFAITWGKALIDFLILLMFSVLYFFVGLYNLPNVHIKIPVKLRPYMIINPYDLFVSTIIGLLLAIAIILVGFYIRKPPSFPLVKSSDNLEEVMDHLKKYGGTALSHLPFLNDKYIYWSKNKKVLFAFQKYADKLIIFGEPIGEKEYLFQAVEEFLADADNYGLTPVFYQVSSKVWHALHENGYDFFNLGVDACIMVDNLSENTDVGYQFEVINPPFTEEFLEKIKAISDTWLHGQKENGYTVAASAEQYSRLHSIAIIKDANDAIIGFAALEPEYDHGKTVTIDMLRYLPDGTSDAKRATFINLMKWAKEAGYQYLHLGTAHFSKVGQSSYSLINERIAAQIYLHGFVHVNSIESFKSEYADYWESKFMAYRKNSFLPFTMLQVLFLKKQKKGI